MTTIMDYLIKVDKSRFLCLFFFILTISCKSQNETLTYTTDIVYEITFGDFFSNDNLVLSLNDEVIFKDVILNSYGSMGVTGVWVKISNEKGKYFITTSQYLEKKPLNINSNKISLETILNDKKQKFILKAKGGKYVLFYKEESGEISMNHTVSKPIFD